MTPQRKAEVNRRLAEFDGWPRVERDEAQVWLPSHTFSPDYTADLNALARLEAKLPDHVWTLTFAKGQVHADCQIYDTDFNENTMEPTEAEARAEALCLYLESR